MSEARKGSKHSEETKVKIGEAHKGKIISEETITKLREVLKGRILSEETKEKISVTRKGRIHSEETKAKISASLIGEKSPNYGKITSEETKAKISIAKGKSVQVIDKNTNDIATYCSGRQAAKAIGCSDRTIRLYINSQKLYKDR